MDARLIAKYPIGKMALEWTQQQGITIDQLIETPEFASVRAYAAIRIIRAIEGEEALRSEPLNIEILSMPTARIMLSLLKDSFVTKKFAVSESKRMSQLLEHETDDTIYSLSGPFGFHSLILHEEDDGTKYPALLFPEYLQYAATFRDPTWKLANRRVRGGYVLLSRSQLIRLMEEAARQRMERLGEITGDYTPINDYLDRIRSAASKLKRELPGGMNLPEAYPPCIKYQLGELQRGSNLPHTARFALTAFLCDIECTAEDIMALYRLAPDFNEDMTRYQVEHIVKNEYVCPSCKAMQSNGNCVNQDWRCDYVHNPLAYYRKSCYHLMKDKKA